MGIMYKGLTFDGVNSLDYGIYITGEGVYNAPTRDVEMINIAGRNGEYALDKGRFNNISITYKAGAFASTQTEFAEKISDFRNAILSKVGYKRLEDDYHTDEYRMAVYMDGLEVDPVHYSEAGEFELTFNCKPQRFLTSGETATAIANNGTITNPTLFNSSPLIQFNAGAGGTIGLGTQNITFINEQIGVTPLELSYTPSTATGYDPVVVLTILNTGIYNIGDTITLDKVEANFLLQPNSHITGWSSLAGLGMNVGKTRDGENLNLRAYTTTPKITLTAGTPTTITKYSQESINFGNGGVVGTFSLDLVYDGNNTITLKWQAGTYSDGTYISIKSIDNYSATVNSTKNTITGDIYIDLDIGEAYKIENGNIVSINNAVNLGSELPVLPPGATTITYPNTTTNFKITPRWWKV